MSGKPKDRKTVDDLPDPNGPGTVPVSEDAHKMVQTDKNVDSHHRSGDRNVDDKSGR